MSKVTILFDSDCTMCTRFKQGLEMIDRDKHIEFISARDDSTYERFKFINKEDALDKVHLIKGEKVFKGGDIVAELVKLYPSVSKLAWLLETEAGKKAMDLFYNKVDELRKSRLNPCPKCNKTKPCSKT